MIGTIVMPIANPKPTTTASCTARRYEVTAAQLPLHCPTPDMALWNGHPQVYIPLQNLGDEYRCPYCSAVYALVNG